MVPDTTTMRPEGETQIQRTTLFMTNFYLFFRKKKEERLNPLPFIGPVQSLGGVSWKGCKNANGIK